MSEVEPLEIYFNGEAKQIRSKTVGGLLAEFDLLGKRLAVELNREVILRERYDETGLSAGDRIEIVHFVGGG